MVKPVDQVQQFAAAGVLLGDGLQHGLGVVLHHRHLVGQGGVEDVVGPVLVGGDVQLLPPADVGPHVQGFGHAGAPEVVVPHGPAGQAHPGAFEPQVLPLQHIGPGGDVQAHGGGVPAGAVVVEGVDALEDGHLVLPQAEGGAHLVVAHLPGELEVGHHDGLPLGELGEVGVEQVHVQAFGGLKVDGPIGGAGDGLGVKGLEVVVQGDGVGQDPPPLQLLLDLQGGGGFPRPGGAGEQDDGAQGEVGQDGIRRLAHLLGVLGVALLQKPVHILVDAAVDLLQLIGHCSASFQARQGTKSQSGNKWGSQAGPVTPRRLFPREWCRWCAGTPGDTWGWPFGGPPRSPQTWSPPLPPGTGRCGAPPSCRCCTG